MKSDRAPAERVAARVVAWHNRHPLAESISAAQVEGVGLVNLPFAIRGARVEPVAGAGPGGLDATRADLPQVPATPDGDAAASGAPSAPAAGASAVVVEAGERPAADAVAAAADEGAAIDAGAAIGVHADRPAPAAGGSGPEAGAAPAADGAAAARESDAAGHAPAAPGPATPAPVVHLPPRPPRSALRRWWQRARGGERWRALFTEDFVPPLRPGRVAAWAAQHGSAQPPLDRDAPQRWVTLDASRRLPGGTPEVDLYLLTAAVVVRGCRHRVLLAPDPVGPVIGPRHWSRPRSAAAGSVAVCLLALGASATAWRGEPMAEPRPTAPVAAASAPATQAPAPVRASSIASAPALPASVVPPSRADAFANASDAASLLSAGPASAPGAVAAPTSRPPDVEARPGRIELPAIKPRLAEADRQQLKNAAAAMRNQAAAASRKPAWALVTQPVADRRVSERAAAQFEAVAARQPTPMRAELMRTGSAWRAVFWPFVSARDAEKARIALADKGLRTEVVEF